MRAGEAKGVALSAIYTDAQFGDLCWSADESMVAFVAEEAKGADGQHDYEEDMGEQLEGKVLPRLYTVAVSRTRGVVGDPVLVPGSGDSCCFGQPQLTVGADGAPRCVFTGWYLESKRLGVIYCPVRPAALFESKFEGDAWGYPRCLTATRFAVAHSPRVSPSGARAIALAHSVLPTTHMACQALLLVDLAAARAQGPDADCASCRVLLNEVRASAAGATFAGLYSPCTTARIWLSDSEVVFSESVRSRGRVLHLAIDDIPGGGPLAPLGLPSQAPAATLLDCRLVDVLPESVRALSCSSPLVPHALYAAPSAAAGPSAAVTAAATGRCAAATADCGGGGGSQERAPPAFAAGIALKIVGIHIVGEGVLCTQGGGARHRRRRRRRRRQSRARLCAAGGGGGIVVDSGGGDAGSVVASSGTARRCFGAA